MYKTRENKKWNLITSPLFDCRQVREGQAPKQKTRPLMQVRKFFFSWILFFFAGAEKTNIFFRVDIYNERLRCVYCIPRRVEEQQQLHNPDEIDQLSTLIDILLFAPRESTASSFPLLFVFWWKLEPKQPKKSEPPSLDSLFCGARKRKWMEMDQLAGTIISVWSPASYNITQPSRGTVSKSRRKGKKIYLL